MERQPNTIYTLSLSYGKDSIASIEACRQLGYPIDRIVHAEIWATDDIPADLPPMVEFKAKADAIIKERYGIEVEHVCATAKDGSRQTYEKLFYHVPKRRAERERERERAILGFPQIKGNWCTSNLKRTALRLPYQSRQRELVYPTQNRSDSTARSRVTHQSHDGVQVNSNNMQYRELTKDFPERQCQLGARNSKPRQCLFRQALRNNVFRYRIG